MPKKSKFRTRMLKIENQTHYETNDLRAFFLAGLLHLGCTQEKKITVKYALRAFGIWGQAQLGMWMASSVAVFSENKKVRREISTHKRLSEGYGILITIPKSKRETIVTRSPTVIETVQRDGKEPLEVPTATITRRKVFTPWVELPPELLLELAQVFEHEVEHTLGFKHADMCCWSTLKPTWHEGLKVRVKALPEKKPRADRMTELVTKREEHAREMATKWAKKAQILKSQVKKANSRCAFWLRTVKYYEKKMAAKKAK